MYPSTGKCHLKYLCRRTFLPEVYGSGGFAAVHKDCLPVDKRLVQTYCLEMHAFPKFSIFPCALWEFVCLWTFSLYKVLIFLSGCFFLQIYMIFLSGYFFSQIYMIFLLIKEINCHAQHVIHIIYKLFPSRCFSNIINLESIESFISV